MPVDEIVNVVMELYAARKEAKEYLEYWLNPDSEKELEKCHKLIGRQFFTPKGVAKRSPSLPAVSKVTKDFMTICFDPERVGDLLLYTTEIMADWLAERYRRVSFRSSLRKYLNDAALYIENHELESLYGVRLERLREKVELIEKWQENAAPRGWWRRRRW